MRRRTPAEVGLRAELAERYRWYADEWAHALPEDDATVGRLARTAAALEAGEPVELAAWELPPEICRTLGPNARITIEPDDSLSPAPPLSGAARGEP